MTMTMKRKTCILTVMMLALLSAVSACGKNGDGNGGSGKESAYAEATDVFDAVLAVYDENERFAIAGGDQDHMVMDGPGKFDVTKTEELDQILGLPADQASAVEDAASMLHMMNANTFTGAVYRLKDGTDMDAFGEAVKNHIKERQWMCGFPDTFVVIRVDGSYVITAFGEAEIMETFQKNALSALDGAEVLLEEPLA